MSDTAWMLPPVGRVTEEDEGRAFAYVDNLFQEAKAAATVNPDGGRSWVDQAGSNMVVYVYGSDPVPADRVVVSHQIQDAIHSVTDQQTKEPPVVLLDPVERGEPGEHYLRSVPTAQPIDPRRLAALTAPRPTGQVDPMTGAPLTAPPAIDPGDVVVVDDKCVANFYQHQFDVYWARGRLDAAIRRAVLYTNIFGWLWPIYEWRAETRTPKLWTNISLRQTYVPALDTDDIAEVPHAGVDWWLDAGQAKAMFPALADRIEEWSRTGVPVRPSAVTELGSSADQNFRRDTVILRIAWLRNQPMPMSPDDACACGHVERREVPVTPAAAPLAGDEGGMGYAEQWGEEDLLGPVREEDSRAGAGGGAAGADGGAGAAGRAVPQDGGETALAGGGVGGAGDEGDVPDPDPGAAGGADLGGGDGAGPAAGGGLVSPRDPAGAGVPAAAAGVVAPAPVPTRVAHFVPGTDVEVDEAHAAWPTRTVIRQMIFIGGAGQLLADDRACPYWDIPVLHTVATPIPYTLFGQGLPHRLKNMQDGNNRSLTAMVDHCDAFGHPLTTMSEGMFNATSEAYKSGRAGARRLVIVPDSQWQQVQGKIDVVEEPVPLAPAHIQLHGILKDEINERAAHPEVLQGQTSGGVKGWQAIQLLQQAATSRYGLSVQFTADMIWRLSQFLIHSLVTQLDTAALMLTSSEYPPHVVDAIRRKALAWYEHGTIDIDVTINTGTGAVKARKKAEAVEAFNIRDPQTGEGAISLETLRDRLGEDHEQEARRNREERMGAMGGMPPPMPMGGMPGPGGTGAPGGPAAGRGPQSPLAGPGAGAGGV